MSSAPVDRTGGVDDATQHAGLVLKSIPTPVVLKSCRGVFLYVNPAFCRLFDLDEQELVGAADEVVLVAEDAAKSARLDQEAMREPGVHARDEKLRLKSVSRRFHTSRQVLHDSKGELLGLLCTYTELGNGSGSLSISESGQLVPICSSCKQIRDSAGQWEPVELYIQHELGAKLTHGLCPECLPKFF